MKKTVSLIQCDVCERLWYANLDRFATLSLRPTSGKPLFEADVCPDCQSGIQTKLPDLLIRERNTISTEEVDALVEATTNIQTLTLETEKGGVDFQAPGLFVWIQEWEESERGWGVRPDGYTIHLKQQDIQSFLADMRAREAARGVTGVPDEYSRPSGEPFEALIEDAELIARVKKAAFGLWGPNSMSYKRITNLKA